MTRAFKVKQFVLIEDSLFILDSKTNQQLRIGTHDLLTLKELCFHAGKIVSKESLLEKGWPGKIVSDSSLTQSIRNIRTLLGDNGKEQKWLKTVPKIGYVLDESIVHKISNESLSVDSYIEPLQKEAKLIKEIQKNNIPRLKRWLNCTNNLSCGFKLTILSLLLVSTANLSYKVYKLILIKQKTTKYPKISFAQGATTIYSDNTEFALEAGKGIDDWLDKNQMKPQRIDVLLLKENLSFAIVDQQGKITNKLILLEKGFQNKQVVKLLVDEVNHAFN